MDKYGFVYIWRDRKHKRFYVGCHWGFENDGYLCSSNWMRDAYKRRPEDFKRRILKRVYTNRKDLFEEEQRCLDMIKPEEIKIRYYNLRLSNGHWCTGESSASVGEKISKSLTGFKQPIRSEIHRKKLSEALSGENHPNFGKHLSDETKQKISESNNGKVLSKEHVEKMRVSRLGKFNGENNPYFGKTHSEETRAKMSASRKLNSGPNKGKKMSEEQKLKISETKKRKHLEKMKGDI